MGKRKPSKYMFLVRWENNPSLEYDGKEHYVPISKMVENVANVHVGDSVTIKWVRKVWKGILVRDVEKRKDGKDGKVDKGEKDKRKKLGKDIKGKKEKKEIIRKVDKGSKIGKVRF